MATIKPNKPECFDGKRDHLAVETFLYQVKQYLNLIQIGNPMSPLVILRKSAFLLRF